MSIINTLPYFSFCFAVIFSSLIVQRIPNILIIVGLVIALILAALNRSPYTISFLDAVVGCAVAFVAFIPLFVMRLVGGADIKLFMVLGAWCGVHGLAIIWVAASSAVLILSIAAYIQKQKDSLSDSETVVTRQSALAPPIETVARAMRGPIPYTVLLTATAILNLGMRLLQA